MPEAGNADASVTWISAPETALAARSLVNLVAAAPLLRNCSWSAPVMMTARSRVPSLLRSTRASAVAALVTMSLLVVDRPSQRLRTDAPTSWAAGLDPRALIVNVVAVRAL